MAEDALAVVEVGSVATGLAAVDALTKRAEVHVRGAGLVEPGRFVILFTGALGEVEEAHTAAVERAGDHLVDDVLLSFAHRAIVPALAGAREVDAECDCVGVAEGTSISRTIAACDRALKDAAVVLAGLRLTPGLGGRAYFVVTGAQHDVIAAVDRADEVLGAARHRSEVIARPTRALVAALLAPGAFAVRG